MSCYFAPGDNPSVTPKEWLLLRVSLHQEVVCWGGRGHEKGGGERISHVRVKDSDVPFSFLCWGGIWPEMPPWMYMSKQCQDWSWRRWENLACSGDVFLGSGDRSSLFEALSLRVVVWLLILQHILWAGYSCSGRSLLTCSALNLFAVSGEIFGHDQSRS